MINEKTSDIIYESGRRLIQPVFTDHHSFASAWDFNYDLEDESTESICTLAIDHPKDESAHARECEGLTNGPFQRTQHRTMDLWLPFKIYIPSLRSRRNLSYPTQQFKLSELVVPDAQCFFLEGNSRPQTKSSHSGFEILDSERVVAMQFNRLAVAIQHRRGILLADKIILLLLCIWRKRI